MNKAWDYAYAIFFSFYVVSLVSSTGGMETFAYLISITSILHYLIHRKKPTALKFNKLGIEFWIFGLCAAVFITGLLSPSIEDWEARQKVIGWVRWPIILYGFTYAMLLYRERLVQLIKPISLAFGLLATYGIVQHFTGLDLLRDNIHERHQIGDYFRVRGLFASTMAYSYSLGMFVFLPFCLILIRYAKEKKHDLLYLISNLLLWVSLVLTFTRGAWISLVAALIFILFQFEFYRKKKFVVGCLVVAAFSLLFVPNLKNRVESIVNTTTNKSNVGRIKIWRANWQMVKERPILGHGYRHQIHLSEKYYKKIGVTGERLAPHNSYLEALSGAGIIGLIFYLGFVISLFRVSLKKLKVAKATSDWNTYGIVLAAIAAQIVMQMGGLTQCNFTDLQVFHMYLFILSILFAQTMKQQPNTQLTPRKRYL